MKVNYSKETALVDTLEKYVALLNEELKETVPIAYAHGWKTTRFERGEILRNRIKELKKLK